MIALAFICLGFLIGNLAGLSAGGVARTLLPLLFAFGGGSAVAFMQKLEPDNRKRAAVAIIALSISCLVGLYSGVLVAEYQWLSPEKEKAHLTRASIEARKYVREHLVSPANKIDTKLTNNELPIREAYEQLYKLINKEPVEERK